MIIQSKLRMLSTCSIMITILFMDFSVSCYAFLTHPLPTTTSLLSGSHSLSSRQPCSSRIQPLIPLFSKEDDKHSEPTNDYRTKSNELKKRHHSHIPTNNIEPKSSSRRSALVTFATTSGLLLAQSSAANAKAEVDTKSGELFSPKSTMLGGGGSDAARGISIRDRSLDTRQEEDGTSKKRNFAKKIGAGGLIQSVYEARFIAYLSRFLLTFDPAARTWWEEETSFVAPDKKINNEATKLRFSEFSESVEVGLADYFVGPYGSYASVQAAKAGILATAPATSVRVEERRNFFSNFVFPSFFSKRKDDDETNDKTTTTSMTSRTSTIVKPKKKTQSGIKAAKQGILNLMALLQARYTSKEEKLQLALLFSFISSPELQPTDQITALLGEADNASVQSIELLPDQDMNTLGGYSITSPPTIKISPPPALGDDYKCAKAVPILQPTSRILKIDVIDGGEGYTSSAPFVAVTSKAGFVKRPCQSAAILDREGGVESIAVLDPGMGYGASSSKTGEPVLPTVNVSPPPKQRTAKNKNSFKDDRKNGEVATGATATPTPRQAVARAELEYQITGIQIVDGGNGYVSTQPPRVTIEPPAVDPDWLPISVTNKPIEDRSAAAQITQMVDPPTNITAFYNIEPQTVTTDIVEFLSINPIAVLPNTIRPEIISTDDYSTEVTSNKFFYTVPGLPPIPRDVVLPSPQYRALDPVFGGVGSLPVTKGALELSVSEYTRLALSGAICTVIVRNLLNPLELVKTKIQLKNDKEILEYARQIASKKGGGGKGDGTKGEEEDSDAGGLSTRERGGVPKRKSPVWTPSREHFTPVKTAQEKQSHPATTTLLKESNAAPTTTTSQPSPSPSAIGTVDVMKAIIELRGPFTLFQSFDVTFLSSLVFGSFGFGATELFRRAFTMAFFDEQRSGGGEELILLLAAALACVLTSFLMTPFEMLRVRSMGMVESKGGKEVLKDFLEQSRKKQQQRKRLFNPPVKTIPSDEPFELTNIRLNDLSPLWAAFTPIVSRELPFAITKFLTFDTIAKFITGLINTRFGMIPAVQVGVGAIGLSISAFSGAFAGIAGAIVSHPADLILTLTSNTKKQSDDDENDESSSSSSDGPDWRDVVQDLLRKEGGIGNLFVGLPARASFFFLVIGLQFFLYDYVKTLFQVGSDDLTLVLDVFYAVRKGLVEMDVAGSL